MPAYYHKEYERILEEAQEALDRKYTEFLDEETTWICQCSDTHVVPIGDRCKTCGKTEEEDV